MKVTFTLLIVFLSLTMLRASKLTDCRPVDEGILMVCFRDGEVAFRDDGAGPTAHDGFRFVPGDDQLIPFGEELDTDKAMQEKSWVLSSLDDPAYTGKGKSPIVVHRKSKANHATHDWQYKLDHWIYLKLPNPLKPGCKYSLKIDPGTGSLLKEYSFEYLLEESVSDAIHINLNGYSTGSPVKAADLYLWLGDGGERDYSGFEGKQVWLHDLVNGNRIPVGKVELWKKSAPEAQGRNLTGSTVWKADFSSFNRPGLYRLVIDGIGCSRELKIRDNPWLLPYKTSVRGYYYMRIGEPHTELRPLPRQPRFLEGKDPVDLKIYMTDLDPYDPQWQEFKPDPFDEPHFKPAVESMFWNRRLPGNPTNPNAYGGHSDALDWDRKLPHVVDIYDLLLPYLLTNGAPGEDNLQIRESGNGIPDLIDEARNQVDFHLRLRVGEAYAHGLTNPSDDRIAMFQAGPTTVAAWANAANCAILAETLRIAGNKELEQYYTDEAIKAYCFAERQDDLQLDLHEEIGETIMRGRDFRMMAAAFLFNLTGDARWENAMAADAVTREKPLDIENIDNWCQLWGTVAYLFTPHIQRYPELVGNMHTAIRRQAIEQQVILAEKRPSRRSSIMNYWQTAQNMHLVMIAHALEKEPAMKKRMLKAMILEADWGLGRNPSNLIEMTGMGPHSVQNAYTSGRNDGSQGVHPGHTPYHNLDPWGDDHNGHNPHWFTDRGYPAWEDGWPHQEAHFNSRYCWSNSEFTPRETMRGKMALYGYLHALNKEPNPQLIRTVKSSDNFDQRDPSTSPPGGLAVELVPQFIVLTFDDNPDIEAMSWMMDTARQRSNPDGSRIPLTFFSNGKYLDQSPELAALHLQAWQKGHEIGNHTQNHPSGETFSSEEWKAEIQLCNEAFTKAGLPENCIRGFRTPFIAYNAATFTALDELDFLYDSSIEEGFQENMDGTNCYWPYTLHAGSPGNATAVEQENREAINHHNGLWQLAVHTLIVPPDDKCEDYGVPPGLRERIRNNIKTAFNWDWPAEDGKITGYDWNLLEMGSVTGEEFLAILKYSFDLKIKGNRAPIVFGGHTALYSKSQPGRRKAMAAFIDYALEHEEVRFVAPPALIDWMRDPQTIE